MAYLKGCCSGASRSFGKAVDDSGEEYSWRHSGGRLTTVDTVLRWREWMFSRWMCLHRKWNRIRLEKFSCILCYDSVIRRLCLRRVAAANWAVDEDTVSAISSQQTRIHEYVLIVCCQLGRFSNFWSGGCCGFCWLAHWQWCASPLRWCPEPYRSRAFFHFCFGAIGASLCRSARIWLRIFRRRFFSTEMPSQMLSFN